MQYHNMPLDGEQLNAPLGCPDTDSSSAKTHTKDVYDLLNPMDSPIYRRLLSCSDKDPLYVSPSNQKPSDNIAHFLGYIFPMVAERAKQNNILLKKEEIHLLDYYINEFDDYCPDYDVTIVVDGGQSIAEEIQRTIVELGLKENNLELMGECCVIEMRNSTHEFAASGLLSALMDSDDIKYWKPLCMTTGRTASKIDTGAVNEFLNRFPPWNLPGDRKQFRTTDDKEKRHYRGIHTTALRTIPRRGVHPTWYPRRACGTLWTTIGRFPRH